MKRCVSILLHLEDPIEYMHAHGTSIIDQREVGFDTVSFFGGLRAALRQDPDVILVGEMRDLGDDFDSDYSSGNRSPRLGDASYMECGIDD